MKNDGTVDQIDRMFCYRVASTAVERYTLVGKLCQGVPEAATP